ncbi:DegT/DnrJ/EryC1/StrS family aminotransferase [Streptomyces sp. NPDC051940]|uniref:DegT/DnrJ/EryC1/StrS family aminotransferase n=1 Tax=Streptomyces sp. NPDC051940 TaxID=3155675 RepID=UPI00343FBEE6
MRPAAGTGTEPVRTAPWPEWPPPATPEQRERLLAVLDSGQWGATNGPEVEDFAAAFAHAVGAAHGVCTVNGTVGLFLALRAVGVGPGDEVIVPAYTFVASASAVVLAGARPVFADVLPDSLLVDPESVASLVGPRTRAVMSVHLAGMVADTGSPGVPVVEDAAQAHGAVRDGRAAGTLGRAAVFSFQSSKAMTAGEGGVVVTDDPETYERLWSLHNVGRRRDGGWYEHPVLGWNLRMTAFQAAVLRPQLALLPGQIAHRERSARALRAALDEVEGLSPRPAPAGTERHTWHLAMLRYDAAAFGGRPKEEFIAAMAAEGIPLDAGYRPLTREPSLAPYARACPVAEAAEASTVWVRQQQLMADDEAMADIGRAARRVREAFRRGR